MKAKNLFKMEKSGSLTEKQGYLREKNGFALLERKKIENSLEYSRFLLHDLVYNVTYVDISIPNPSEKDLYKTIFLKYQGGVRDFLIKFFDVLVGDREDIEPFYKTKCDKDLKIEKDDNPGAIIKIIEDEKEMLFGIINFIGEKKNCEEFAENFINLFEGQPVEYSWKKFADLINLKRDSEYVDIFMRD